MRLYGFSTGYSVNLDVMLFPGGRKESLSLLLFAQLSYVSHRLAVSVLACWH